MEKRGKKKKLVVFIIILAILLLGIFSTRIYLVINLLLGNDLIIKINPDEELLNLKHYESEEAKFDYYILTNPFCSAECSIELKDLNNQIIENESLILKPTITQSKEYTITANKFGIGEEVYRFKISCKGIKSFLCPTSGEEEIRSSLMIVKYDLNDEEKIFQENTKAKITNLSTDLNTILSTISYFNSINILDFNEQITSLIDKTTKLNNSIYDTKNKLENLEYTSLAEKITSTQNELNILNNEFLNFNVSANKDIQDYNLLVDNLNSIKKNLENLKQLNVSNENFTEINSLIDKFNKVAEEFNKKNSISDKDYLFRKIYSENLVFLEEGGTLNANETILNISEKIIVNITIPEFKSEFKEPSSECCLFNKCEPCCENCSNENYPIILLHGHSFNKKISSEYSLQTFQKIQQRLEEENYVDAGSMLISETEQGIWSKFNYPLTIKASYYFDLYKNPKESSIIQTKSDNLDSYALRLNEIITNVKYKTGKDKVIIVTHSMGGLVVRKYLQIFGDSNVDKILLISTPNNGIQSSVQKFCSFFGEQLECRDMTENSLFLNKLNYGKSSEVPITNLIGTGCKMGNETGDGIVTESNSFLTNANNYKIEGSCDELKFKFLHDGILDIEKYPEVYEQIVKFLEN